MIISEQWLRTWVDVSVTTQELSHKLTMIGLEVDSINAAAEPFSGVVVAEIISAELALRTEGIPALDLWEVLLGREVELTLLEDNQATIKIIENGKFQAMRPGLTR